MRGLNGPTPQNMQVFLPGSTEHGLLLAGAVEKIGWEPQAVHLRSCKFCVHPRVCAAGAKNAGASLSYTCMRTFDVSILSHLHNIRAVNIKVERSLFFSYQYHTHAAQHIHTKLQVRTQQHNRRIFLLYKRTPAQRRERGERRCTPTPLIWEVSSCCCCKLPSVAACCQHHNAPKRLSMRCIKIRRRRISSQKNVHRASVALKRMLAKILSDKFIY